MKGKKTIILGITGSIAAYKSLELVRRLVRQNIEVIPVLTSEAKYFVNPLPLETLSTNKVYCDFFEDNSEVVHISLGLQADAIVVAPATANFIGKLAGGIVDNLLLGIVFAFDKPVLIAPAMNTKMWENPIVAENVAKLKKLGYHFVEPQKGELATRAIGIGRLADVDTIFEETLCLIESEKVLSGKKVLITLGRTKEYLDPVRYISNDASGKFGIEIAKVARRKGAEILIIAGFTDIQIPSFLPVIRVTNTEQMAFEVTKNIADKDVVIMNAACSDYTPQKFSKNKIKKTKEKINISFKKTKDILSLIKAKRKFTIAFSVDTVDAIKSAKQKMDKKGVDIMIMNPVETAGSDLVKMTIIQKGKRLRQLKQMKKAEAALEIVNIIAESIRN